MLVTELGIVTDVKPLQPRKALLPMLVTELGIVTDVKPVQKEKANSPMLVTEYDAPSYVIDSGILIEPLYFSSPFVTSAVLSDELRL